MTPDKQPVESNLWIALIVVAGFGYVAFVAWLDHKEKMEALRHASPVEQKAAP